MDVTETTWEEFLQLLFSKGNLGFLLAGLILGGAVVFFLSRWYYEKFFYVKLTNELNTTKEALQQAESDRELYKSKFAELEKNSQEVYDYLYAKNALSLK